MVEVTKIGNKTLVMDGKILSLFRKGSLLRQMYYGGYEDFDGANGGVWKKYINIPIKTVPLEYAQYLIEIDDTNVSVYNAKGDLKAQASIASEFWSLVRSDGFDIRAFDHLFRQLWFWVEEFDYANKIAKIWIKLPEFSEELNIAFGNSYASESSYNNPKEVFEWYDDFTEDTLANYNMNYPDQWSVDTEKGWLVFIHTPNRIDDLDIPLSMKDYRVFTRMMTNDGSGQIWHTAVTKRLPNGDNVQIAHKVAGPSGYAEQPRIGKYIAGKLTVIYAKDQNTYANNWYEYETWFIGDYIKFRWAGPASVISEVVVTHTDAHFNTEGSVRIHLHRDNAGSVYSYIDLIIIHKSIDPATFGTPRIMEF